MQTQPTKMAPRIVWIFQSKRGGLYYHAGKTMLAHRWPKQLQYKTCLVAPVYQFNVWEAK